MKKSDKLFYAGLFSSIVACVMVIAGTGSILAGAGTFVAALLAPYFFIGSKEEHDAEQKEES